MDICRQKVCFTLMPDLLASVSYSAGVLQKKDAERILEFLVKHTPHAVLVGTTNIHSKALMEDLSAIRDHILENQPQVFKLVQP